MRLGCPLPTTRPQKSALPSSDSLGNSVGHNEIARIFLRVDFLTLLWEKHLKFVRDNYCSMQYKGCMEGREGRPPMSTYRIRIHAWYQTRAAKKYGVPHAHKQAKNSFCTPAVCTAAYEALV